MRSDDLTAEQLTDMAATLAAPHASLLEGGAYGYGVWVFNDEEPVRVGLVGDDPGFSARAYRYPDTRLQAVVLSNLTDGAVAIGRTLSSLLGIESGPTEHG